jgi:ABC-type polysaccharide/polyol phosphate export permease
MSAERVLAPPRWTPLEALTAAWRDRALIPYFGRRFLERRYARTVLGWLWIPLRPTLDVGARVLLFGGFLGVASGDRPYFMFFVVGTAAWQLFDRTAFWATRAIEMNRTLFSRVHVSRLAAVAAAVVPGVLDFLLYAGICAVGATYYLVADGTSYLILDPRAVAAAALGVLLIVLSALAVGLWTSALAAETRDARFFFRYLSGFWYFITPVIYPISTAPVELVKYGVLSTAPPTTTSLAATAVFLVVVLAGGLWFAARSQRAAVERI